MIVLASSTVWCVYTYPLHDERAVGVRVVIVRGGRQRPGGRAAARAAAVLGHGAQARPVTELGTDRQTQPNGMGKANKNMVKK